MGVTLPPDIKMALMDPRCVKILSTVNKNGDIHLSFKTSFRVRKDGDLECDEFDEYSLNNKNMFYAIWCDKIVILSVHTYDRRKFKLVVRPSRAIVSGDDFFERFRANREQGLDHLNTLWVIEALSFIEITKIRYELEESEDQELVNTDVQRSGLITAGSQRQEPNLPKPLIFQFTPRENCL
jgi:hypothetical protein